MTVRELIDILERVPDNWEVQCDGQDGGIKEVREVLWKSFSPGPPRQPFILIVAGADD